MVCLCQDYAVDLICQFDAILLSYPNFVRRLSFFDLLILISRLTVLNASYSAKHMIIQCFDQECENTQRGGQKGHFKAFIEPWLT